jgi:crotonobetainyl-CoA:carnitine CoA-transferase CaiB-like acyl-CoA transferase
MHGSAVVSASLAIAHECLPGTSRGDGHRRTPFGMSLVYDPVVQALSGLTTVQAGSDTERPKLIRTVLPDKLTAMAGSQAICAALVAPPRTGEGQHIQLSMLDTVLSFLWASDMNGTSSAAVDVGRRAAQSTGADTG